MQNLSCICGLHHSSRQRQILNPLSEARDRTCILMDTSQIGYSLPLSHEGNSKKNFFLRQKRHSQRGGRKMGVFGVPKPRGEGVLKDPFRSSHCGTAETNLTRNHEVAGSIPGLTQGVRDLALL